jgi:hypothetical protein
MRYSAELVERLVATKYQQHYDSNIWFAVQYWKHCKKHFVVSTPLTVLGTPYPNVRYPNNT